MKDNLHVYRTLNKSIWNENFNKSPVNMQVIPDNFNFNFNLFEFYWIYWKVIFVDSVSYSDTRRAQPCVSGKVALWRSTPWPWCKPSRGTWWWEATDRPRTMTMISVMTIIQMTIWKTLWYAFLDIYWSCKFTPYKASVDIFLAN